MIKKLLLLSFVSIGAIGGGYFVYKSSGASEYYAQANDVATFSILKQVSTAQSVHAQENGSYAHSLEKLYDLGHGAKSLFEVVQSIKSKSTYKDHTFVDIIDDSENDDTRSKYALQANSKPGSGCKSYLLIMDQNKLEAFNENQPNSDNKDIQYYESTKVMPILNHWPSNEDLSQWTLKKLSSPQDAMKKLPPEYQKHY